MITTQIIMRVTRDIRNTKKVVTSRLMTTVILPLDTMVIRMVVTQDTIRINLDQGIIPADVFTVKRKATVEMIAVMCRGCVGV